MKQRKNIYFASDFHLGVPDYASSLEREKRVVAWLDEIKQDAAAIYLVGDIFDFWFEYKYTAPKYYTRLLGKIAEITDSGIPVHYFIGNHDMWTFGYLEKELGVILHRENVSIQLANKQFLIGHGDGKGPGDKGYKRLKKVFRSPVSQWLFARLHPNLAFWMAQFWSYKSRVNNDDPLEFVKENEWLYLYCRHKLKQQHFDYFVFGHRHLPVDVAIDDSSSRYINLGDWIVHFTYAVFDGDTLALRTYPAR